MGYLLNVEICKELSFPRIRRSLRTILVFAIVLLSLSCSKTDNLEFLNIENFPEREKDFSMWQLAQFDFEVQMCYIIRSDDGKITVVDGGMPTSSERVTNYLNQFGGHVHTWITTHPHLDHIGALQRILFRKEIQVDRILHSRLDEDWTFKHENEKHNLVSNYNGMLDLLELPVVNVKKGDVFSVGDGVDLEIIAGKNDTITTNAINNSSLVFKIKSKSKSVLFLGDLGVEGGSAILKAIDNSKLKADFVQMAHHGQGGVGLEFYKAVDADYALWPTPKWLWENKAPNQGPGTGNYQTPEVRNWVENELKIKKSFVAGLEGNIQID